MKTIMEIIEWAQGEIDDNKDLMMDEPNTSHGYTAYLSVNDALNRLIEFIEEKEF